MHIGTDWHRVEELSRQIRSRIRRDKTQWLKDHLASDSKSKSPKDKWRWIKRVRKKFVPQTSRIRFQDGTVASSHRTADAFAEYLEKVHWACPPEHFQEALTPRTVREPSEEPGHYKEELTNQGGS